MRKLFLLGVLAAAAVHAVAISEPVIEVIPTLGPDLFTSGNFAAWRDNVISGLRNGTTPGSGVTQFNPLASGATVTANQFLVSDGLDEFFAPAYTPFPSWEGMAGPTGTFASELGTVLYFALRITAEPGVDSIRLADLVVDETYRGVAFGTSPVGGDYRAGLIGVQADGTVISSGADTQLVNQLYYVGAAFGQPLLGGTFPSDQARLDATRAAVEALSDRTTQVTYSLVGNAPATGTGSVSIPGTPEIPEPGTWMLLSTGLAGLAMLRRRKA